VPAVSGSPQDHSPHDHAESPWASGCPGLSGGDDAGPAAIPEELAAVPVGPELGGLLARIDVERISGFDTVEVLKAAYRQFCHERARFLAVLLEVGLREPFSGDSVRRSEVPDEFGPDEARAALVWSRRRSDSTFERAWDVHRRLPMLGEAMLAGSLDEPRAAAFIRWTAGLTVEQAHRVCDLLLPEAPGWTVGELVEQIQRMVLAIDPEWAEKQYRSAVRRRRVIGIRNEDGTATVSGLDLPLDRAAAGCERIDDLARACKRAGDARPIDHIRADLFLGSLDGSFEGMSDEQMVAHVLAHPFIDPEPASPPPAPPSPAGTKGNRTRHDPGRDPRRDPRRDEGSGPGGARPTAPTDPPGDEPGPTPSATSREEPANDQAPASNSGPLPRTAPGTDTDAVPDANTNTNMNMKSGEGLPCGTAPVGATRRVPRTGRAVSEVRVELTALLGLDEHPAHVPGWGHVHAGLARQMVAGMFSGEWRFAVCTDDGHLLHTGVTRHRPCASSARPMRDTCRGGIVELQITETCLAHLVKNLPDLGLWAALVGDLARQTVQAVKQIRGRAAGGTADVQTGNRDRRRRAHATLRRYVQIRGRVCSRPGCRVPAIKTDQDHAIDWAARGTSTDDNLHLACRHDHRAKHEGGWRVTMPEPTLIVWISPLGHRYPARLPPIMTPALLPCPQPRDWPDTAPESGLDDVHIMTGPPHLETSPTSVPGDPAETRRHIRGGTPRETPGGPPGNTAGDGPRDKPRATCVRPRGGARAFLPGEAPPF
jgi:hypothetical protein